MIKENYANNFEEFLERFQTEDDCLEYIEQIRWPEGFKCSKCQWTKAWKTSRGLLHCSNCGHDTSITAGIVFENTRKPLTQVYQRDTPNLQKWLKTTGGRFITYCKYWIMFFAS